MPVLTAPALGPTPAAGAIEVAAKRCGSDGRGKFGGTGDNLGRSWRLPAAAQLGSDLRAVRFDELRHEEPVISNLVGRHDDQVECQPIAGDLLQVAHELHEVRRREVEDDDGAQPTIGERIGESNVECCIVKSGIGLGGSTRSLNFAGK